VNINMTAVVGISAGTIGLILGVMLPKQQQSYGMAVVTGTTTSSPEMQGYVEKVDAVIKKWGCEYVARERNTLLMEGNGGPLTVITRCPGATLQDGIDFYQSPEYQELVKLRAPFTDWDFRLVEGTF
jgi:uncharacterized protein (DUF1330 family)